MKRRLVMFGLVAPALAAFGLVALAMALVAPRPASAEHDVPYRYTVLGYVTDDAGRPRPGADVVVVREKTGLAYRGETDDAGFFVVVVRLGDESAGEWLTLRVDDAATRVRARFDPANHRDERGTRVDLEGARFVPRPAAFRPTLTRVLGESRR